MDGKNLEIKTNYKRTSLETELKDSEEKYREVFNNAND